MTASRCVRPAARLASAASAAKAAQPKDTGTGRSDRFEWRVVAVSRAGTRHSAGPVGSGGGRLGSGEPGGRSGGGSGSGSGGGSGGGGSGTSRPSTGRPGNGRPSGDEARGEPSRDRGSATVWAAGLVAVLLLVGAVGVDLVSAVRARHVADTAADMAALAAAGSSSDGEARACAAAGSTAGANGAVLRECRLDGWDALVRVDVDRRWTLVGRGPATSRARAGPAPVGSTGPTGSAGSPTAVRAPPP